MLNIRPAQLRDRQAVLRANRTPTPIVPVILALLMLLCIAGLAIHCRQQSEQIQTMIDITEACYGTSE